MHIEDLFKVGIDEQEKEKFIEELEKKYLHITSKKYGKKYLLAAKPDKILKMKRFISSCNEEDGNDFLIISGYIAESVVHVFDSKREQLRIAMS